MLETIDFREGYPCRTGDGRECPLLLMDKALEYGCSDTTSQVEAEVIHVNHRFTVLSGNGLVDCNAVTQSTALEKKLTRGGYQTVEPVQPEQSRV